MSGNDRFFLKTQPTLETERLRIVAFDHRHSEGMFRMDANPKTHIYLGTPAAACLAESVQTVGYVQRQYHDCGIGRWAVEEKTTGEFLGWTGFKWLPDTSHGHGDYMDVGYRYLESHWGQGIATEAGLACMAFASKAPEFEGVPFGGTTFAGNIASERVLQKLGLHLADQYECMGTLVSLFKL